MAEATKSVNLTVNEIKTLIQSHGSTLYDADEIDNHMERLNYLHKRLKAFTEAPENAPVNKEPGYKQPAPATQGWT